MTGAGWRNWKKCSGVMCDRRMPGKLKGNVYKRAIRPAMLYEAETWATMKRQEKQDENVTLDVRSDPQRQDQERTHPRNNESDAGFQKDHGETIELVRACDEER